MSSNAARTTSDRSLPTVTVTETRAAIAAMLLRDGAVDGPTLERTGRLMGKLGDEATLFGVLSRTGRVDDTRLLECVRRTQPDLPIGALLTELGLVGHVQLRQALQQQVQGGFAQRIGEILVAKRMLRERDLTRVLAAQSGYASEEPEIEDCDPALLERLSLKASEQFGFLPLRVEDGATVVAFVDPLSQAARTEAARTLETSLRPVMTSATTLKRALAALARRRQPRASTDARVATEDSASGRVNRLLASAIEQSASDIHVEPLRDRVRVRLRIDGILREQDEFPLGELDGVVSRLKIMAEADISERRRHQDGRIAFENPASGGITDLRASFYVTVNGECVVLRVLNQNSRILALDEIDMSDSVLERFKRQALESPSGVIIVTGPTGSGKTSTLYSCVNHLNNETTSIITAEDPVEFQVDGIAQCTMNRKIGRTFDESIRHIVRQDPDVIVLGEIRDASSAESAIQAALTGHKVLTTFHTEDSIGGLLRLMNMNIEAFLISSTVVCVLAQRLLRRVCRACAHESEPELAELQFLGWNREQADGATFREGEGCPACHFTGYAGRIAVFEALVLSEAVREAILERKTSAQIRRVSVETSGLVTLLEDGLIKAARGDTTLAEVRRTLPRLTRPRSLSELGRLTGIKR